MPRHEYRTIEEFLQMVESHAARCEEIAEFNSGELSENMWKGKAQAWRDMADILRNSNLGIVYPPEGKTCTCETGDGSCKEHGRVTYQRISRAECGEHIHATEITGEMGVSRHERKLPCSICEWGH